MVTSLGRAITPLVGVCRPANSLSKVDFPAPFLPTKAMRSFLLTTKEMASNRVKPPNSTVKPSIEIMCCGFQIARKDRQFARLSKGLGVCHFAGKQDDAAPLLPDQEKKRPVNHHKGIGW